jgi:2-iminobutanoate/2-iminopropanoate deaminase
MTKYAFSAPGQAPPVGPYSPAVVSAGFVFVSGQIGVDAEGNVVGETAADQAVAAMDNLRAIVLNTGLSMADVVKTTIFLTDIADFAAVNEVYAGYFEPPYPARSTVQVAALPKGVKVEIEALAMRGS